AMTPAAANSGSNVKEVGPGSDISAGSLRRTVSAAVRRPLPMPRATIAGEPYRGASLATCIRARVGACDRRLRHRLRGRGAVVRAPRPGRSPHPPDLVRRRAAGAGSGSAVADRAPGADLDAE